MSEIKQYRVNDDAMTCREVNPHEKYLETGTAPNLFWWEAFEATVINYPLTVEQKPGEAIEGKIVWKFFNDHLQRWAILPEQRKLVYDNSFDTFKSTFGNTETCLAVEPVTPSKEVKEDNMKTGIELIAIERQEQIEKHGYDADFVTDSPEYYAAKEMAFVANIVIASEFEEGIDPNIYPESWPTDDIDKILRKPYKERLIIAGALLAAEIDRLQNA